jgi:hypothetical protein
MKMIIFIWIMLALAALYGWRIHPEAIGKNAPVFTRNAKDNVMAKWKPAEFLDRFSGERDYRKRQEALKAEAEAKVSSKQY